MSTFSTLIQRIRLAYARRFEPEGVREVADVFWRTTLMLACAASLIVLIYGVWTLLGVLSDLSQSPGNVAPPKAYLDRAQLKAVLEAFDERTERFTSGASSTVIADPH